MQEAELDVSDAKRRIVSFIKEKVEASGTDGVVFELTGNVNSAVSAYLCIEALGTRRVTGLLMPDLRVTKEKDTADAREVASELCLSVQDVDIAPIHKAFMKNLEAGKAAEDNLRARIRMALLYYHANTTNRLVVGTGNKSEILMGRLTKYGEMGVDILPIGDLYESGVRRLGEVLGINRRMITKREGARAVSGQVARSESGLEQDTVDRVLELGLSDGLDAGSISSRSGVTRAKVDAVISRYEWSLHKRAGPEVCRLR